MIQKTPTQQLIEIRFNRPIEELLRERFAAGDSLQIIGEEWGVSWQSVNNWARKYRIPPRKAGRKNRSRSTEPASL